MTTDRMEAAMSVEAPERIWIESDGGCPYFYHEEELSDVAPPITEYVRADKLEELAAEVEALRAEVERLNRILGRIVEGDVDSTTTIRAGADAFAAAREYLRRNRAALAKEDSNDCENAIQGQVRDRLGGEV